VPIYEYQCDTCGHTLEALQKISDAPLKTCPECNTDTLRKKVSAAAFRLKGTGWYETDFKKKQPAKQAADSGAGDAGKTESKSASGEGGDSKATDTKPKTGSDTKSQAG
jgi:putative FmdB family regulatory protein